MKLVPRAIVIITVPLLFNVVVIGGITAYTRHMQEPVAGQGKYGRNLRYGTAAAIENLRAAEAAGKLASVTGEQALGAIRASALASAKQHAQTVRVELPDDERQAIRLLQSKSIEPAAPRFSELIPMTGLAQLLMTGLVMANVMIAGVLSLGLYRDLGLRLAKLNKMCSVLPVGEALPQVDERADELQVIEKELVTMANAVAHANKNERDLLNSVPDIFVSLKADGLVIQTNQQGRGKWSLDGGRNLNEVVDAQSRPAFSDFLGACVNSPEPCQVTFRVPTEAGLVPYRAVGSWDDRQEEIFLVARDISNELRREESRGQVLTTIGHDLKAPLSAVRLSLAGAADGIYGMLGNSNSERLKEADARIDQILGSLNELLDFEKLESGNLKLDMQRCNASDLIVDVLDAANKVPEYKLDLPQVQKIECDASRIEQALSAIINAAQDLSDSEVKVRASAVDQLLEVLVSFKARRVGGDLFAMFDRYAAHAASGQWRLALPLARAIVEAHGGCIDTSAPDCSESTNWFRIRLPFNQPDENSRHSLVTRQTYADKHGPKTETKSMNAAVTTQPESTLTQLHRQLFAAPTETESISSVLGWWESRRSVYNLAVGVAGLPGVFYYQATGHVMVGVVIAVVLWAVLANLCYSIGPWSEIGLRKMGVRLNPSYAPDMFRLGFLFSIMLTFLESVVGSITGMPF